MVITNRNHRKAQRQGRILLVQLRAHLERPFRRRRCARPSRLKSRLDTPIPFETD